MRLTIPLSLLAVSAMMLVGCGSGDSTASSTTTTGSEPAKSGKLQIAMIPKGSTHEFWKTVHSGAATAAKELDVDLIWKGPLKEDDRDSQISTVQDFVTKKVSGIALAPLDDSALRQPADEAQKAGIPVVIFDSGLKDIEVASFVATDNEKGGHMAGEHLAKILGGKGRVILLKYQEGSASTEAREKGFLAAMKENPGITIISENQYAGPTTETAQKASENLLAPLKKADGTIGVDGIFTPNESSTFGMLRTLQDGGWVGKVKFVGFDASAKLIEGLKAGQIDGLIVQNPRNMGYLAVKTLVSKIKGENVEKRIDTGATLVTKDNMAQPDIAKLLAGPDPGM